VHRCNLKGPGYGASHRVAAQGANLKWALITSKKVKAIPLQAFTGPEGSWRSRLPDFKIIGTRSW